MKSHDVASIICQALVFGAIGVVWVVWVGGGIFRRGGAMPDAQEAVGPTGRVEGLTGKRKMLPIPALANSVGAEAVVDAEAAQGVEAMEVLPAMAEAEVLEVAAVAAAVDVAAVEVVAKEEEEEAAPSSNPFARFKNIFAKKAEEEGEGAEEKEKDPPIPWGELLQSTPLRALCVVHFCNNWGFYVLLAWLPSYFTQAGPGGLCSCLIGYSSL